MSLARPVAGSTVPSGAQPSAVGGLAPAAFARVIGIDLRALAAFRIGLATCVLYDLALRANDLRAHYTDDGVLLRKDLLELFVARHDLAPSLFLVAGSVAIQAFLMAVAGGAAVFLLIGLRTRAATIVTWLLLTSLHLRDPFVVYGGDTLLRMMLFWGMFLPLGARLSIEAAPYRTDRSSVQRWASIASAALLLQIVIVYFVAGAEKLGTGAWAQGDGLALALDNDLTTRWLGERLREQPLVCRTLSYLVMMLELVAPVLLLVPAGAIRIATVVTLAAMHLGIASTMRVGIFPFASITALLVFVPSAFWRTCARWISDRVGRTHAPSARRAASRPRATPVVEAVAAVALAYVVVWNVGLLREAGYAPPPAIAWVGDVLYLKQRWGMFARPRETGWFVIAGRLRDGRDVDLMSEGGPVPDSLEELRPVTYERPAAVARTVRNVHWLAFFAALGEWRYGEGQFQSYGRYLCREFNEQHRGEPTLDTFELIYMVRPVTAGPRARGAVAYERRLLWRHDCFG